MDPMVALRHEWAIAISAPKPGMKMRHRSLTRAAQRRDSEARPEGSDVFIFVGMAAARRLVT